MAGMLPGVECARRRRFHQRTEWADPSFMATRGSTRKSSFCLYTSNNETPLSSISSLKRSMINESTEDEKLDESARVAKERLDERLRAQRKSEAIRHRIGEQRGTMEGKIPKIGVWGRLKWARLKWKKSKDKEECPICLELCSSGPSLVVHLPCPHKFHSLCLLPWLERNAHCPCCRMQILS